MTRAAGYRKTNAPGHDTWHFCTNCSNWPTTDYDSSATKPTTGEFCNECMSKEQDNDCK